MRKKVVQLAQRFYLSTFGIKNILILNSLVLSQLLVICGQNYHFWAPFLLATLSCTFQTRVGMKLSKPNFRIEEVVKEDVDKCKVRYVNIQDRKQIEIVDMLFGFLGDFIQNFIVFAIVIAVQVAIRFGLWRLEKRFMSNSKLQRVHFFMIFILLVAAGMLASLVTNCVKCAIFARTERKKYLRMLKKREEELMKSHAGNGEVGKVQKVGDGFGQGSEGFGFGDVWRKFRTLEVVGAFAKIVCKTLFCLTIFLAWANLQALLFFAKPFLYVSFGFFFRKVMNPQFQLWVTRMQTISLKNKQTFLKTLPKPSIQSSSQNHSHQSLQHHSFKQQEQQQKHKPHFQTFMRLNQNSVIENLQKDLQTLRESESEPVLIMEGKISMELVQAFFGKKQSGQKSEQDKSRKNE